MGRRQGRGYCWAGLMYCLTNEVIKIIIIENEILRQIQKTKSRTGSETRPKKEDGEREQVDKERRCRTQKREEGTYLLWRPPNTANYRLCRQVPSGLRSTQLLE